MTWAPGIVRTKLPRVIAHRGASGSAPENTLIAVRRAAEMGAEWVELDVNVSADGVAVILHDDTLDRTTDGTGPVILRTHSEISMLDAGSWFGREFAGEPVPTLTAMLATLSELGLGLNLEIKPTPGWEEPTARIVVDTIRRDWAGSTPLLLSSFSERALGLVRDKIPNVPRAYLSRALPEDWAERLKTFECMSMHLSAPLVPDAASLRKVKDAGFGVLVFTVNDPDRARRLYESGVDGVFTDYPERFARKI